jgi:hypothetical protein
VVTESPPSTVVPIQHVNLRGPAYYQQALTMEA